MKTFVLKYLATLGVLAICLAYFVLWYFWPWIVSKGGEFSSHLSPSTEKAAQLGQLGDSFGSLTALFSGAGFFFVAWTLFLQIQELKEQREGAANERKRQQTLLFYNLVSSPETQAQLCFVEAQLNKRRIPAQWSIGGTTSASMTKRPTVFVGNNESIQTEDNAKIYYQLLSLNDLCRDALSLFTSGLVDKQLFVQLLRARLSRLVSLFEIVDFREDDNDNSAESVARNQHYREPAKRLKALLEAGQPAASNPSA